MAVNDLVYPGGVAEGVFPDHGLVGLHRHTGDPADQTAGRVKLGSIDANVHAEQVFASVQTHDYLFQ